MSAVSHTMSAHTDIITHKKSLDVNTRLTDDVLCELYYLLAHEDPPRGPRIGRKHGPSGSLGWIRLTHVCRQWRRVGVELSLLWARIVCVFPPDVAETVLSRTRSAPIDVDLTHYTNIHDVWLCENLQKLPLARCRVYKDRIYSYTRSMIWHGVFAGRTFSFLEELSTGLLEIQTESDFVQEEPLTAPALRTLVINTPQTIIAPSLTNLTCTNETLWDWRILLNFLKSYPLLETLCVSGLRDGTYITDSEAIGRVVTTAIERTPSPTNICLSHLRTLELVLCVVYARAFLDHLDLPVCTTLKVDAEEDSECWEHILSRPEMSRPERRALSLHQRWDDEAEDSYWAIHLTEDKVLVSPDYNAPGACGSVYTSLGTLEIDNLLNAVPDAAAGVVRELAIAHVCDINQTCQCGWPEVYKLRLTNALARFSGVTVLHFSRLFHDVFVDPKAKPSFLFPALHTIVVEANGTVGQTEKDFWIGLRKMLTARKAAGSPVARLIVRGNALCHRACPGHEDSTSAAKKTAISCLQRRVITLEQERKLVGEVVDERAMKKCDCGKACEGRSRHGW